MSMISLTTFDKLSMMEERSMRKTPVMLRARDMRRLEKMVSGPRDNSPCSGAMPSMRKTKGTSAARQMGEVAQIDSNGPKPKA